MAFVIDASVAIARRLPDRPGTPYAGTVIEQGGLENVVVPDLFWHEVRSVLLVAASPLDGRGRAALCSPCRRGRRLGRRPGEAGGGASRTGRRLKAREEDRRPVGRTDFKSDGMRETCPVGSTPTLFRHAPCSRCAPCPRRLGGRPHHALPGAVLERERGCGEEVPASSRPAGGRPCR